ncbi:MAG: cytochrome C, partial [Deltaproteobacteria bacterium]
MKKSYRVIALLLAAAAAGTVMPSPAHGHGKQSGRASSAGEKAGTVPCSKPERDRRNGCLDCHEGIEPIRCAQSGMASMIEMTARESGTGSDCAVCHGGDPSVRKEQGLPRESERYRSLARKAHTGAPEWFRKNQGPKDFYPDPGSPWINLHTCGPCHKEQVEAQWRSPMMTEAGKIQGTAWGFGGLSLYEHRWANYETTGTSSDSWQGAKDFVTYMERLAAELPGVFPRRMLATPAAPGGGDDVRKNPSLAAFTYARGECQRCHLGVQGARRYGDWRGMGCSACHVPYANDGRYRGGDECIDRSEPGHLLVHMIQSTADAPVELGGNRWSGIAVETCTTCHNRGRRIGVSYEGLMETPYPTPWTPTGEQQRKVHGKHYLRLSPDVHQRKGMVCQDCHTSLDVHGANILVGAITAAVEIECTDCHGTTRKFPWELPLGWGDEYGSEPAGGRPRGTSPKAPAANGYGAGIDKKDGFLLTARGNPFENVVRDGDEVVVHLASGKAVRLEPLKTLFEEGKLPLEGVVAMDGVARHVEKLECYACHSGWAPQCYGCHIRIDYSKDGTSPDWVEIGRNHGSDGLTSEDEPGFPRHRLVGSIKESRSFLRWEDPPLGVNGEGRVAPVIPGCQTTVTVIDREGKPVIVNHVFRIPNVEGGGPEGQLAIDMAP